MVVLGQLPRQSRKYIARLQHFAQTLSARLSVRHAFKFRHPSWFDDEVAQCLNKNSIAASLADAAEWPMGEIVTTDLIYIRLHGRPHTYASAYSASALDHWAARVRGGSAQGRGVHVYFDSDGEGAAPFDARKLMTRLAKPCGLRGAGFFGAGRSHT